MSRASKGALDPKGLQGALEGHQREHGCRVLSAQIVDSGISDIQCVPWPGFGGYVARWRGSAP